MKKLPEKLLKMIENGHYQRPEAMIKVDIEPPFVGADFEPSGCDPSFHEYKGMLYLVFVDNGIIKIALVDPVEMKVINLIREIDAPNVRRPRLIFEPSTHPGREDLPHIGYTDLVNKKAMVYREQYNAQGEIERYYDEIGNGWDCESIRMGTTVIDFFVGMDGILYSRPQGQFAEVFVDYTADETKVVSSRVIQFPDARFGAILITQRADGVCEALIVYSEILGSKIWDEDKFFAELDTHSLIMKQCAFQFDEQFCTELKISKIELLQNLIKPEEYFQATIIVTVLKMPEPYIFDTDKFCLQFGINHLRMDPPHKLEESFFVTLAAQSLDLIIERKSEKHGN